MACWYQAPVRADRDLARLHLQALLAAAGGNQAQVPRGIGGRDGRLRQRRPARGRGGAAAGRRAAVTGTARPRPDAFAGTGRAPARVGRPRPGQPHRGAHRLQRRLRPPARPGTAAFWWRAALRRACSACRGRPAGRRGAFPVAEVAPGDVSGWAAYAGRIALGPARRGPPRARPRPRARRRRAARGGPLVVGCAGVRGRARGVRPHGPADGRGAAGRSWRCWPGAPRTSSSGPHRRDGPDGGDAWHRAGTSCTSIPATLAVELVPFDPAAQRG